MHHEYQRMNISLKYRPVQPILDFLKTTIFMIYKCYNDGNLESQIITACPQSRPRTIFAQICVIYDILMLYNLKKGQNISF